jgi:hypothetical protein
MQSSSTRPRNTPARPAALLDRARSLGLGVVLVGVIAIACDRRRESSGTPGATDSASLQTAVATGTSESRPRGIMAPAPSPVVADAFRESAGAANKATVDQSVSAPLSGVTGSTMPPAIAVSQPTSASSMIVRTGYAGIEVDSLDTAIARVRGLAQRVGGFVANTTVQGGRDQLRSASLEVKVPAERFDEALNALAPIGKVESVNVTAEDVGEEYVDISARVENAHRLESRLIALLATRTGKLQDVLSVERELARVREEIERYEGRLRFLKTRAAMSTLTIAVHERAPIIVPVAGDGPIVVALRDAWRNFVGFVAAFIASLGVVIPLGALAFGVWIIARRWLPTRTKVAVPQAGVVTGD